MNRVCKIYVKNVKSAFPIIGKSERLYIKKNAKLSWRIL